MSLGVLNNLFAIYAENSLNNSNKSLNSVLQQLSSGSKINSGADDAAGLSLVNGLQANQMALTQSVTNATEGVGLLQVADGALSQVTSLLNRAVTLATEASNGTLNSSQDTAANQEYQSILSEISNIGSTTTYNDAAVFNTNTNIYTGDSTTTGSSINTLNIRTLSSSNVGDSGGAMSYSNGSNNVFINLSSGTQNAAAGDALSGSATTINVNYLVKGNGAENTASTTISTGGTTGYANTVSGLISAINDSGLGLNASFATQAQAGVQGGGTQTGIQITGGLVSAGLDPSTASTSGTLDLTGLASTATLALGATVAITQGATSHTFTIDQTNDTLSTLATAINNYTANIDPTLNPNPNFNVNASVVTNGDGSQSLALADGSGGGALSVLTSAGTTQTPNFVTGVAGTTVTVATQGAQVTGNAYVAATASHITIGTGSGTESSTDNLTVGTQVTITNSNFAPNGAQADTFIVGNGTNVIGTHASTYYTGNTDAGAAGDTLQGLTDAINAVSGTLGAAATDSGTAGITVTASSAATAENITATSTLTSSTTGTQLGIYAPVIAGTTVVGAGSPAVTALDNGAATAVTGDTLSGSITITNSYGSTTFVTGAGSSGNGTIYLGAANTYTGLVAAMTAAGSANLGYTAQFDAGLGAAGEGALVLTSTSNGIDPITASGTLADVTNPGAITADAGATGAGAASNGTDKTVATSSTAILQLSTGSAGGGISTATLSGAIKLNLGAGVAQVFIMGTEPTNGTAPVNGAIYTGANTAASLITAINSATSTTGISASAGTGADAGDVIYLQGAGGVAGAIGMNTVPMTAGTFTPLAVSTGTSTSGYAPGATGALGNAAVDNLTAENNSSAAVAVNTNDVMSGSIVIANGSVSDTFNIGTGADSYSAGVGVYYTNNTNTTVGTGLPGAALNVGNTLADLATLISDQSATLDVTAQANASGLTLTQSDGANHYTGNTLTAALGTDALVDVSGGTYNSAATSNQLASVNDTLGGALVFTVGSAQKTVTMAQVAAANSNENVSKATVQQLVSFINANSTTGLNLGVSAAFVANTSGNTSFGNLVLTSGTEGPNGTVTVSPTLSDLVDTTSNSALSYTSKSAYNTGLSGSITDTTTQQAAAATFSSDSKASSGIATISYTDGAGVSLSATDLTNQNDAQGALLLLNSAITAVAAQDGYVGAQINTLNAVSQVLSTQQENVQSAQNAVQATDYASATSNMSKYEILSQTGIAALAQANTVQQEVLKLI